jgi:hypothetical protein
MFGQQTVLRCINTAIYSKYLTFLYVQVSKIISAFDFHGNGITKYVSKTDSCLRKNHKRQLVFIVGIKTKRRKVCVKIQSLKCKSR